MRILKSCDNRGLVRNQYYWRRSFQENTCGTFPPLTSGQATSENLKLARTVDSEGTGRNSCWRYRALRKRSGGIVSKIARLKRQEKKIAEEKPVRRGEYRMWYFSSSISIIWKYYLLVVKNIIRNLRRNYLQHSCVTFSIEFSNQFIICYNYYAILWLTMI